MDKANLKHEKQCAIHVVNSSFEHKLNKLKEFWERRFINGNDTKILENEHKNLSEKYGKNLTLSHNYG